MRQACHTNPPRGEELLERGPGELLETLSGARPTPKESCSVLSVGNGDTLQLSALTNNHLVRKQMSSQPCLARSVQKSPAPIMPPWSTLMSGALDGQPVQVLIDTGSRMSVARADLVGQSKWKEKKVELHVCMATLYPILWQM